MKWKYFGVVAALAAAMAACEEVTVTDVVVKRAIALPTASASIPPPAGQIDTRWPATPTPRPTPSPTPTLAPLPPTPVVVVTPPTEEEGQDAATPSQQI